MSTIYNIKKKPVRFNIKKFQEFKDSLPAREPLSYKERERLWRKHLEEKYGLRK